MSSAFESRKLDLYCHFLPRLVIEEDLTECNPPYKMEYKVVCLSAEIAGHSTLNPPHSQEIEQLKQSGTALNNHFEDLMHYVSKSGGDLIKFTGDRVLAVWPVDPEHIKSVLHGVVVTALWFNYQEYNQALNSVPHLTLRTAISVGNLTMKYVGNALRRHYIEGGPIINDLHIALQLCDSNNVILSPIAVAIAQRDCFDLKFLDDNRHALVLDVQRLFPECGVLKSFKEFRGTAKTPSKRQRLEVMSEKKSFISAVKTKLRTSSAKTRMKIRAKNLRSVAVDEIFSDAQHRNFPRMTRHRNSDVVATLRSGCRSRGNILSISESCQGDLHDTSMLTNFSTLPLDTTISSESADTLQRGTPSPMSCRSIFSIDLLASDSAAQTTTAQFQSLVNSDAPEPEPGREPVARQPWYNSQIPHHQRQSDSDLPSPKQRNSPSSTPTLHTLSTPAFDVNPSNIFIYKINKPMNLIKYYHQFKVLAQFQEDISTGLSERQPEVYEHIMEVLGLYIIPPVLQLVSKFKSGRPKPEVKKVCVIYMNVTPVYNDDESPNIAQIIFLIINKYLLQYSGCLSSITTFEKGLFLLIVFGLATLGVDKEKNPHRALRCAWNMWVELMAQFNIGEVSIGISSGLAFCGIIGQSKRMEYTVIGKPIHLAAHILVRYPGKIICDKDTFLMAKLVNPPFKFVPRIELKEDRAFGTLYEIVYLPSIDAGFQLPIFNSPLIGREKEHEIFGDIYQTMPAHKNFIVYFAGKGGGKTRLLSDIYMRALMAGLRVVSLTMSHDMDIQPYTIMGRILQAVLDECGFSHQIERDHDLMWHLSLDNFMDDIYYLQPMLNCKVRPEDFTDKMSCQRELLKAIFTTAAMDIFKLVIIIDNAHLMDKESWQCISVLHDVPNVLTIMSTVPDSAMLSKPAKQVINHKNTMRVKISPIDPREICTVACQMMEVVTVPQKILRLVCSVMLQEFSNGSPHWCKQFLLDLQYNQVIARVSLMSDQSAITLHSRRYSMTNEPSLAACSLSSCADKLFTYVIQDEILLPKVPCSLSEMIEGQIDNLTSDELVVVKWASVFGPVFNRRVLSDILPYSIKLEKRGKIINGLLRQDVFCCAGIDEKYVHIIKENQQCCNCDYITFKNPVIRSTIQVMLQPNQHSLIHNKAALCYESMSTVHKNRVPYYLLGAKVCSPADVLAMTNTQAEDPLNYTMNTISLAEDDIPLPARLLDGLAWNKKICSEISICLSLYESIVYHWRRANRRDLVVVTLVEATSAAIALKSDDLAGYLLKIVRAELRLVKNNNQLVTFYHNMCCTVHRLQTKIYEMQGETQLMENECLTGLILMGYKMIHSERQSTFYTTRISFQMKLKIKYPLLFYYIDQLPFFGRLSSLNVDVLVEEKIRSFITLYHLSTVKENDRDALYYACHLYRLSQSSKCTMHFFIECYAIVIDSLYVMQKPDLALILEEELYEQCKKKVDELFPDDFANLAVIFGNRSVLGFMRNSSPVTLKFARFSIDIYVNLDNYAASFDILPKLIRAELRANVCQEVSKQDDQQSTRKAISLLKSLSQGLNNLMARAIYFSSCIDILIDAGVAIESIVDIITYAEQMVKDKTNSIRIYPQLTNILAGLAHWYSRQKNWLMADTWYQRYSRLVTSLKSSPHDGNALCKIIEFNLLKFAAHYKSMSVSEKEVFESYIERMMDALSVVIKIDKSFAPRALHLDAYWHAIRGFTNIAQYDLNRCIKTSVAQNNKLETELVRLHVKHWTTEESIMLIHHPFAWPLPSIKTLKLKV